MKRMRFVLVLLALLGSASVSAEDAYKVEPGPFEIGVAEIDLPFPELQKQLPLRIAYPVAQSQAPVIVFSHGGGCPEHRYTEFADHWASHGYIVIEPTHADSRSLGFSFSGTEPRLMTQVVFNRRNDMKHILDSLDYLEEQVPQVRGRLDRSRLVASGHSMGGATAMAMTGLALQNNVTGAINRFDEDRFDLLLLIGDPGNRAFMPEAPWRAIAIPTLVVTGTYDNGQDIDASRMQYEFADGTTIAETPNHYLFIDGMDHYMGGLICRSDVEGEPDHDALLIAKGVSTAFLDAYTKEDDGARQFLEGSALPSLTGGRATLQIR